MEPLIVTGFLLAVALLSIMVDRYLQKGRVARRIAKAHATQQIDQGSLVRSWRNRWANVWSFRRPQPADLSQQLRAWATTMLTEEAAFQHWLMGLSDEDAQAFTAQLAAFYQELGLTLPLLFDPEIGQHPALQKTLEEVALSYCHLHAQAAQAQVEMQGFQHYRAFKHDATVAEHLRFAQQLYAQLVENGVVPAASSSMFLAPEVERREYLLRTIAEVERRDRAALNQALCQVIVRRNAMAPIVVDSAKAAPRKPNAMFRPSTVGM
ncbi:MAG: hypothetical protein KDE19_08370 [Caldilineaceae bacterium]|nr:hypothetical protein [Caldilineaceae bacterium]